MNRISKQLRLFTDWAGMIGPALFVTVFTIEGWLRPGYEPLKTYVSALSLGPRGWIQICNFILLGILLFIFTRGMAAEFPKGKASRSGITLLTIIAFCYLFSGPFVMDPSGTQIDELTVHGTIHGILGAIAFLLMPITCFVYLRHFNIDPQWRSMRGWTLVLGTISAASLILLTLSTKFPQLQAPFANWIGLIQRGLIIPFMLWIFVFALTMIQRRNKTTS